MTAGNYKQVIAPVNSSFGWAVGQFGDVWQWNNAAWTDFYPGHEMSAISASLDGTVLAVADAGTISSYANGNWDTVLPANPNGAKFTWVSVGSQKKYLGCRCKQQHVEL